MNLGAPNVAAMTPAAMVQPGGVRTCLTGKDILAVDVARKTLVLPGGTITFCGTDVARCFPDCPADGLSFDKASGFYKKEILVEQLRLTKSGARCPEASIPDTTFRELVTRRYQMLLGARGDGFMPWYVVSAAYAEYSGIRVNWADEVAVRMAEALAALKDGRKLKFEAGILRYISLKSAEAHDTKITTLATPEEALPGTCEQVVFPKERPGAVEEQAGDGHELQQNGGTDNSTIQELPFPRACETVPECILPSCVVEDKGEQNDAEEHVSEGPISSAPNKLVEMESNLIVELDADAHGNAAGSLEEGGGEETTEACDLKVGAAQDLFRVGLQGLGEAVNDLRQLEGKIVQDRELQRLACYRDNLRKRLSGLNASKCSVEESLREARREEAKFVQRYNKIRAKLKEKEEQERKYRGQFLEARDDGSMYMAQRDRALAEGVQTMKDAQAAKLAQLAQMHVKRRKLEEKEASLEERDGNHRSQIWELEKAVVEQGDSVDSLWDQWQSKHVKCQQLMVEEAKLHNLLIESSQALAGLQQEKDELVVERKKQRSLIVRLESKYSELKENKKVAECELNFTNNCFEVFEILDFELLSESGKRELPDIVRGHRKRSQDAERERGRVCQRARDDKSVWIKRPGRDLRGVV